jgi:hypothetical protein
MATHGGHTEEEQRHEGQRSRHVEESTALSPRAGNLVGCYVVIRFNSSGEPGHTLVSHTPLLDQTAVRLIPIESIELRIRVTDGEILRELGIGGKVSPMGRVLPVNGEGAITRPLAALIDSTAIEAARTMPGSSNARERCDSHKQ